MILFSIHDFVFCFHHSPHTTSAHRRHSARRFPPLRGRAERRSQQEVENTNTLPPTTTASAAGYFTFPTPRSRSSNRFQPSRNGLEDGKGCLKPGYPHDLYDCYGGNSSAWCTFSDKKGDTVVEGTAESFVARGDEARREGAT